MEYFRPRLHPQGQPFILIGLLLTIAAFVFLPQAVGWLLLIATGFVVFFFRHPLRTTPLISDALVSAADGIVTSVEEVPPPPELSMGDEPRLRISVFLSVFDVHVNRMPADGIVRQAVYVPGKFLNAALDKASEDNERQLLRIERPSGDDFAVVQIAGLIARRIVCDVVPGDEVSAGKPFGIIRFGSRVDVYCPLGFHPWVIEGQRMVGGETILAAARPPAGEGGGVEGRTT
ncbi:MAG: phosphatidylserine decarboxylase [Alphaproteobacteria bacterium]|nr:MAG: phosphatidylserine decarboxylase [Alphaproteobacteria bacterium]